MLNTIPNAGFCSLEEQQQALRRALDSRTFSRSEQMRSFLEYVCRAAFRGESATITEYVIGTEVLHRPPGYSPAEDSSVRTRAYELRQKLERLYAEELINESIRIVIPKGAYTPQFLRRESDAVAVPSPLPSVVVSSPGVVSARNFRLRFWSSKWIMALLVTAFLSGTGGYWLSLRSTRAEVESAPDRLALRGSYPILREAWGPLVAPNRPALLIPATPLYLVLGPGSHHAFGGPTYPAPPEAYALFQQQRPLAPDAHLGMVFTNDALGVGNLDAVVIASHTLRDLGAGFEIRPERPSMLPALHGRGVIAFGAPVDSELITQLLEKTPLTVDYEEGRKEFVIQDRENGGVLVPEKSANGDYRSVYGLITVLNTRDSDHGRLGTLVFSGITSVGTHGAAEYFASPRSLNALLSILHKGGQQRFPSAYQVVVKCRVDNLLLVSEQYQTHRILHTD